MIHDDLKFDAKTHEYRVRGNAWPSVTQIIKTSLRMPWLDAVDEDDTYKTVMWRAAAHGTLVHTMCEMYVLGEVFLDTGTVDEAAEKQFAAFKTWYDENVVELFGAELRIVSERYRFAGTLDLLVRLRDADSQCLIDIKSGSAVDDHYARAQTAAYLIACVEMGLVTGHCRRGVLHIPGGARAGSAAFLEHSAAGDHQAFLSMVYLHRWLET